MSRLLLLAACLLLPGAASAAAQATPQQPDPHEQWEAKLASPFLKQAAWVIDYDAARADATARERLILGYFTTVGP